MDSDIATLSRWADEEPRAMLKLLSDGELRHQLFEALRASGALENEDIEIRQTGSDGKAQ